MALPSHPKGSHAPSIRSPAMDEEEAIRPVVIYFHRPGSDFLQWFDTAGQVTRATRPHRFSTRARGRRNREGTVWPRLTWKMAVKMPMMVDGDTGATVEFVWSFVLDFCETDRRKWDLWRLWQLRVFMQWLHWCNVWRFNRVKNWQAIHSCGTPKWLARPNSFHSLWWYTQFYPLTCSGLRGGRWTLLMYLSLA